MQSKKKFYNSLQVYRGIAALMVVFHHLWIQAKYFLKLNQENIDFIAGLGKYGVDFFFVLSGFIITVSNFSKAENSSLIPKYALNRVLRIYIPYLPIGIFLFFLYKYLPNISQAEETRNISFITSFFLFPHGRPALGVAWTLVFEMFFYLMFCVWFFSKRLTFIVFATWAVIVSYFTVSGQFANLNNPIAKLVFSNYNLEFLTGFVGGYLFKQGIKIPRKPLFILSILVLIAVSIFKYFGTYSTNIKLVFAVGFLLLILGSINGSLDRLNPKHLLMKLGNASYSIYLVHGFIISILIRLIPKVTTSPYIVIPIIFVVATYLGVVYSKVFEEFFMKKAKQQLGI